LLTIRALTPEETTQRLQELTADKAGVMFLREPSVSLKVAQQNVADGKASFDDRVTMILHNASIQQWDEMWKHVEAVEQLGADKPGVRWLRTVLLATIRRNEEARQRLIEEAGSLVMKARQDDVFLANFLLSHANSVSATPEFRVLHQQLKPVYVRPLAERVPLIPARHANDNAAEERTRDAMAQQILATWNDREASSLEQLGRSKTPMHGCAGNWIVLSAVRPMMTCCERLL
jgi:hypothetical protein